MNLRPLFLWGGLLIAVMLGLSAWAWPQIPDGAQVPIHWGPSGDVDGYGPKWAGLLGIPAIAVGVVGLLAVLPRIEPRRANLARSTTAYVGVAIASVGFMAALHAVAVLAALGSDVEVTTIAILSAGVMLAAAGAVLSRTHSNWFFGIRTPWTLSSERSWRETHRIGGALFVATGLAVIAAAVVLGSEAAPWVMLAALGLAVAASVAISYFAWRDDPARGTG